MEIKIMEIHEYGSGRVVFVIAVAFMIISIAMSLGCGTKKIAKEASESGKSAQQDTNKMAETKLPVGDKYHSFNEYRMLSSGNQIMFLYYGFLNSPPPYEKIAEEYSEEYKKANDAFKKQDIINALKKQIDQEIAASKNSPYVYTQFRVTLHPYDMDKKGFGIIDLEDQIITLAKGHTMKSPNSEISRKFSDNYSYRFTYTNTNEYAFWRIEDQEKARKIESLRSNNDEMKMKIYSYAQVAEQNVVKMQILKIQFYDSKGNLIGEM
jgi:hypothetical protein